MYLHVRMTAGKPDFLDIGSPVPLSRRETNVIVAHSRPTPFMQGVYGVFTIGGSNDVLGLFVIRMGVNFLKVLWHELDTKLIES